MASNFGNGGVGSAVLSTCRLIAGGVLVFAGLNKLGSPTVFMSSIEAFELLPAALIPFSAYGMIWTELIVGMLLLYGLFGRASALIATGLYAVFIVALVSVIARGMPLDCGCFGGAFGGGGIGWHTVARNLVFTAASLMVVIFGPGRASLDAVFGTDAPLAARSKAHQAGTEPAVLQSQEAS